MRDPIAAGRDHTAAASSSAAVAWPATSTARDRFVLDRRAPRPRHDPWRHHGVIVEDERAADDSIARVATVFLTGRECPWRCVMCDLWRYTIDEDTPIGAIPAQIAAARRELASGEAAVAVAGLDAPGVPAPPVDAELPVNVAAAAAAVSPRQISVVKLYNAGSFFDPRAVPEADYGAIAAALTGLSRVIVECHPSLVGWRVDRLLDALNALSARTTVSMPVPPPRLEVAMGLETAHPAALERLHKRITLDRFACAAEALRQRGVALRVFLLIAPPFIPPAEQDAWLLRSIDAAISYGASAITLIPTRGGNGALEALAAAGEFRAPTFEDIERSADLAFAYLATSHRTARVRLFVDLWDVERFTDSASALSASHAIPLAARRARLHAMNLQQCVLPRVSAVQA